MIELCQHGRVDETDARLIAALARDGRASFRDLAEAAGVSPTAARARATRLLGDGTVRVVAKAHPAALGQPVVYLVTLRSRTGEFPPVDEVAELDGSAWIARSATAPELIFQMAVPGLDDLYAQLRRLEALPWVETAHSTLYLRLHAGPGAGGSAHTDPGPWRVASARPLDAADRALVGLLRADGRAGYTALASAVGLSVAATRQRVLRLLESGAIRLTTLVGRADGTGEQALITLRADAHRRAGVIEALTALPGVDYFGETTGPNDLHCSLVAPTLPALAALTAEATSLPGVLAHTVEPIRVLRHRLAWTTHPVEEDLAP
ncbi:Lrp/AsnC family transcriptional regulator [Actinocorallia aurea]